MQNFDDHASDAITNRFFGQKDLGHSSNGKSTKDVVATELEKRRWGLGRGCPFELDANRGLIHVGSISP